MTVVLVISAGAGEGLLSINYAFDKNSAMITGCCDYFTRALWQKSVNGYGRKNV